MKNESFMKGTLILIVANAFSKILGALLKIPLTYILGEQGMAIYQTAFSVYIMILSLITSGIPFAISKYISEELALSRLGNIRFTVRFSVFLMFVLGLFSSALMFFGADFFAYAMKDPKSTLALKAIAPSIFFVALGAVYKSCYQGYAHQMPTAISQIIEAFIKLIAGYSLAFWFSAFSVRYASAAAVFGVTAGEALATFILFLLYIPYRRETLNHSPETPRRDIIRTLLAVAVPMTAASVISGSLSLLETSVIRNRLTSIIFSSDSAQSFLSQYSSYTNLFDDIITTKKLSLGGARWLYGAYSGYAATVFNLPCGILASFGVSILPVVTRCIALKNYRHLNFTVASTSKIILAISMPCAAIMSFFSKDILSILFKNTASMEMLSFMAPLLVIITLIQFLSSVQYASGKIFIPFIYNIICMAVKILLSYLLIAMPSVNIMGVIISTYAAASLQLILILRLLKKNLGISPLSFANFLKIILCTLLMLSIALLLYSPLSAMLRNYIAAFFLTMIISALGYIAAIFLFGVMTGDEIARLRH